MGRIDDTQGNADVTFIIMYDISDGYTRKSVAGYLLREGCLRVQHSVFMGNLPYSSMKLIVQTLKDIKQAYDNDDSYIIVPLRKESLDAMVAMGNRTNLDMVLRQRHVVFL